MSGVGLGVLCLALLPSGSFGCSSSSAGSASNPGGSAGSAGGGGVAGANVAGAPNAGAVNGGMSGANAASGGNATAGAGTAASGAANAGAAGSSGGATAYDALVLADQPVAYWGVNLAPANETDLTGNGHDGTYEGGTPPRVPLPNGSPAADFNGSSEYLSVPSSGVFSVPTTGNLTWEAWLRPDVLQFPHDDGVSGYVDWMGKCEDYSPTCEWEARMYDTTTMENPNRPNRLSAYVFNPSAGLGSAADWQPSTGLITTGTWYHVVGEYTTLTAPADCTNTAASPGSINIWVNGVEWNQGSHGQTGCMSQYNVVPEANTSPLDIGTMTKESFFQGALGDIAIYDHLLTPAQITSHYLAMTGKQPSGTCADTCSF